LVLASIGLTKEKRTHVSEAYAFCPSVETTPVTKSRDISVLGFSSLLLVGFFEKFSAQFSFGRVAYERKPKNTPLKTKKKKALQ
jgi:hypothetical protein